MSSGSTESIVPDRTEREERRERYEMVTRPSGVRRTCYTEYSSPYPDDISPYPDDIPPSQGYAPPGPPPPYVPPPYPYQSNYTQTSPAGSYYPDYYSNYYPNANSSRQPYPGPPPGYHAPRSRPTWPQYAVPPRVPNAPPAPPTRSPRVVLTPQYSGFVDPNPYMYLQHHAPGSPFANIPAAPRVSRRHTEPMAQVNLDERPETLSFWTEQELYQRMTDTFRPLVGIIGRIVQEQLHLQEQPKVKFDMYPVRADDVTGMPLIVPHSMSRGPMFQITLPAPGGTRAELERVRDALIDEFATHPNAWHRQAGFVFRISRRFRVGACAAAKRSWVPPSCVYRYSRTERRYVAQYLSPILEDIRELDAAFVHGDDSDDDQDALVNDMWRDVRRRSYFACNQDPSA